MAQSIRTYVLHSCDAVDEEEVRAEAQVDDQGQHTPRLMCVAQRVGHYRICIGTVAEIVVESFRQCRD